MKSSRQKIQNRIDEARKQYCASHVTEYFGDVKLLFDDILSITYEFWMVKQKGEVVAIFTNSPDHFNLFRSPEPETSARRFAQELAFGYLTTMPKTHRHTCPRCGFCYDCYDDCTGTENYEKVCASCDEIRSRH